jgi:hypothetical protein
MAQSQQHILMLTNIQNDRSGLPGAAGSGFPGFPGYQPDDKSDNYQYNNDPHPNPRFKDPADHCTTIKQTQHQYKD